MISYIPILGRWGQFYNLIKTDFFLILKNIGSTDIYNKNVGNNFIV